MKMLIIYNVVTTEFWLRTLLIYVIFFRVLNFTVFKKVWKKWMWNDSPAFQSQHKWRRSWRWADRRTAEPVDRRRNFSAKHCGGWYTNGRGIHGVCHTDLKGLDKSPEQRSNAFAFTEQLDQPQHSKQAEEGDGHFSTFTFALKRKTHRNKNTRLSDKCEPSCVCTYLLVPIQNLQYLVAKFSRLTSPWPPPP